MDSLCKAQVSATKKNPTVNKCRSDTKSPQTKHCHLEDRPLKSSKPNFYTNNILSPKDPPDIPDPKAKKTSSHEDPHNKKHRHKIKKPYRSRWKNRPFEKQTLDSKIGTSSSDTDLPYSMQILHPKSSRKTRKPVVQTLDVLLALRSQHAQSARPTYRKVKRPAYARGGLNKFWSVDSKPPNCPENHISPRQRTKTAKAVQQGLLHAGTLKTIPQDSPLRSDDPLSQQLVSRKSTKTSLMDNLQPLQPSLYHDSCVKRQWLGLHTPNTFSQTHQTAEAQDQNQECSRILQASLPAIPISQPAPIGHIKLYDHIESYLPWSLNLAASLDISSSGLPLLPPLLSTDKVSSDTSALNPTHNSICKPFSFDIMHRDVHDIEKIIKISRSINILGSRIYSLIMQRDKDVVAAVEEGREHPELRMLLYTVFIRVSQPSHILAMLRDPQLTKYHHSGTIYYESTAPLYDITGVPSPFFISVFIYNSDVGASQSDVPPAGSIHKYAVITAIALFCPQLYRLIAASIVHHSNCFNFLFRESSGFKTSKNLKLFLKLAAAMHIMADELGPPPSSEHCTGGAGLRNLFIWSHFLPPRHIDHNNPAEVSHFSSLLVSSRPGSHLTPPEVCLLLFSSSPSSLAYWDHVSTLLRLDIAAARLLLTALPPLLPTRTSPPRASATITQSTLGIFQEESPLPPATPGILPAMPALLPIVVFHPC